MKGVMHKTRHLYKIPLKYTEFLQDGKRIDSRFIGSHG